MKFIQYVFFLVMPLAMMAMENDENNLKKSSKVPVTIYNNIEGNCNVWLLSEDYTEKLACSSLPGYGISHGQWRVGNKINIDVCPNQRIKITNTRKGYSIIDVEGPETITTSNLAWRK